MAKNGNKKKDESGYAGLKSQTKHGIVAVIFFVLALFFLMSAFGMTGVAGKFIYEKLFYLLGIGYILLPALLAMLGYSYLKSETPNIGTRSVISATMFLLSGLGMIDIASGKHSGGLFGEILSTPLVSLFDPYASIIFLGGILIISILVIFDAKLDVGPFFVKLRDFLTKKKVAPAMEEEVGIPTPPAEDAGKEEDEKKSAGKKIKKGLGRNKEEVEEKMLIKKKRVNLSLYQPPPLSLLEEDQGKPNTGDIKANANIIKRTLQN